MHSTILEWKDELPMLQPTVHNINRFCYTASREYFGSTYADTMNDSYNTQITMVSS